MQQPEKYNWKEKDIKIKDLSYSELLSLLFFNKLIPFLVFITRYFPFSLLWQNRRFHYKFRDITAADDFIIKVASERKFWFRLIRYEKSSNFITIIGKFKPLKRGDRKEDMIKYFRERVQEKDIFIDEYEDNKVNIRIANNLSFPK